MVRHLSFVLALVAPALAACGDNSTQNTTSQLLISGSGYIWSATFDGTNLTLQNNINVTGVVPSWLMQGKAGNSFIANDENANTTNTYTLGATSSSNTATNAPITPAQTYTTGSTGIVHLVYNVAKTRMFGAGYGSQTIDIWDTTSANNTLTFLATIPTNNTASKPHQTVVSPAGDIAIVNDLGLDTLHILAVSNDDAIAVTSSVPVPAGCGPRHGAFYTAPGSQAPSRYLVACELSHTLLVFNVTGAGLDPAPLQDPLQTVSGSAGADLTAAELLLFVNDDASADVYVSNRNTGGEADSIAHFRLPAPSSSSQQQQPGDVAALTEADLVSSGGIGPRGMSLSADGKVLFVGNQQAGPVGVAVLARDAGSGALGTTMVASVGFEAFAAGLEWGFGPQFVAEVGVEGA